MHHIELCVALLNGPRHDSIVQGQTAVHADDPQREPQSTGLQCRSDDDSLRQHRA
jgi:hypothetical protein